MSKRIELDVPMNRVEGDLEIKVAIEEGVVVDAWSIGTLYRGFENILRSREALDALVYTPRVCGICGTAHLTSTVKALEMVAATKPPANAVLLRHLSLAAECLQNDMRQAFLMYTPDFANPYYEGKPLYEEAKRRYEPFKGESVRSVIRESKHPVEIIAIIGGQWPHSSYMVPGGICTVPSPVDLAQCKLLVSNFKQWYEREILGCSIEEWHAVRSISSFDNWLQDKQHADSELGFFSRFCQTHGLDKLGKAYDNFLSYGCYEDPYGNSPALIASGFISGDKRTSFEHQHINEHVYHSWYEDYGDGRHPYNGETKPLRTDDDHRYSWAKAPRYIDAPAETGALAELMASSHTLITELVARDGASAFTRVLARIIRPALLLPAMAEWLDTCIAGGDYYQEVDTIQYGEGYGLVHAARGALGHWVQIEGGCIEKYQIVTPTAWNGSPRDSQGQRGPWEQALVGIKVKDLDNPIELGHVIRSFDPCLVCTVHAVSGNQSLARYRLGN